MPSLVYLCLALQVDSGAQSGLPVPRVTGRFRCQVCLPVPRVQVDSGAQSGLPVPHVTGRFRCQVRFTCVSCYR